MKPPTARQLAIHAYMLRYFAAEQMWPTMREICKEFEFASTNAAHDHLERLRHKGYVRRRPKLSRGWIAIEQVGVP